MSVLRVKLIVLILAAIPLTPVFAHWKIPAGVKDWKYFDTPHFRIHYPEGYDEMAFKASVIAEESSARFGRILNHRMSRVIPVFLYASHQDFAATNILPFDIGEGTGGFTDFLRQRVVVPFNGDYSHLRHVLAHEIVHAYQFDILRGESFGAYPLWLMEGMAEYLSLGWDDSAENHVRDGVLHDRLPDIFMLQAGNVQSGYMYYKGGQAAMLYIASIYGEERIGAFLKEIKALHNMKTAIESAFHVNVEDFNIGFGQFMRSRYKNAIASVTAKPDDRVRTVTNRYEDRIGFNLHPVISPDGKKIAYMTAVGIFPGIVIRPVPGPDVAKEKFEDITIVLRALRTPDYEEYQPLTTRLSFSPDGGRIAFAGRRAGKQALLIVDIESREITEVFEPPFDAVHFPIFSPDGESILFVGVARGRADIFSLNRKTNLLARLTSDECYESSPALSGDGKFLFYSTNCSPLQPDMVDLPHRQIYRLQMDNPGAPAQQITNLPGSADYGQPSVNGSFIFLSNFTGVSNLYRIENALTRNSPAGPAEVEALTRSSTGVFHPSVRVVEGKDPSEIASYEEMVEGAYEIRVLPPGNSAEDKISNKINKTSILPESDRTYNPGDFAFPTAGVKLAEPVKPVNLGSNYQPSLGFDANTFVWITGASSPSGKTSLAAMAFTMLTDDAGDHRLAALVSVYGRASTTNFTLEYAYLKYRIDFFMGIFRQAGNFAVFNFTDLSLNNILYNPYFRILSRNNIGMYAGAEYPLHRYGALTAVYEQGRDEQVFRQSTPEQREQQDIFQNHQSFNLSYRFNNVVYSMYGPMDGHSVFAGYSVPFRGTGTERNIYSMTSEYRFYHFFSGYSTFAFRAFAGAVTGPDAKYYPYRLGGLYSLRGYDFLEFEGTKAFMLNLEYRFNFIEYLQFGVPSSWSPGLIRGVIFADAGSAFDSWHEYQAYDGRFGVTRDLHLSYGAGIQWAMGFLFPGAVMKIEWATPYDMKRSLPLSKWRGVFSLGFNF